MKEKHSLGFIPNKFKYMENCIFCKIIAGAIPCYKVYEDDDVLAFLDITPVNLGHTLVIPKKHYVSLLDLPEDLAYKVMRAIKKIAPAVIRGVEAKGFNLNMNNGVVAGQVVDHAHFHIVPRIEGDGYKLWPGREGGYKNDEAETILKSIKDNL